MPVLLHQVLLLWWRASACFACSLWSCALALVLGGSFHIFHVFIQTIRQDVGLITRCRYLISFVISIYISATVIRFHISLSTLMPNYLWPADLGCLGPIGASHSTTIRSWGLFAISSIEHALPPQDLLLLLLEHLLFHFGLPPVLVGDLGEDTSMLLCPTLFLILQPLVLFRNFTLNDFFSLFYERPFKPILEFQVADILVLLLHQHLLLVLLY